MLLNRWFDLRNYAQRSTDMTVANWANELKFREPFFYVDMVSERGRNEAFTRWCFLVLRVTKTPIVRDGEPTVIIGDQFERPRYKLPIKQIKDIKRAQTELDRGRKLLAVTLDSPDDVLEQFFKDWLVEQRKSHKSPIDIKKRGPKSSGVASIKPDLLRKWHDLKILPLYDLQIYQMLFNVEKFTNAQLYELLFPCSIDGASGRQHGNTVQLISKSKAALSQAISLLPQLEMSAAAYKKYSASELSNFLEILRDFDDGAP